MIKGSFVLPRIKNHKMFAVCLVIAIISINCVDNSVIRQEGEQPQSLYNDDDKVFVLTNENFYQSVFDQPYASKVEFYNSFCGFCRNFAPIYKAWAEDVYGWRDIVRVTAIDCANDGNNDVCRDMEIMKYPTLKFFPPNYKNETNNLGIEIQHPPMDVGEKHLIELMANVTSPPSTWPNLNPIDSTSQAALFATLPSHIKYVFMVYGAETDMIIANKVALDLNSVKSVQIRPVSLRSASKLGLSYPSAVYVGIKSTQSIAMVKHLPALSRESVRSTIVDYLKTKGIEVGVTNTPTPETKELSVNGAGEQDSAIVEYVKQHPGVVYQADIESAIRFAVFHELLKYNHMNDEQIVALKRFLSVLQKFSPLGDNGQRFLIELNAYVETETNFSGKILGDKIKEIEKKHQPVFSSSKFIGCRPSVPGRRGYSCGLWQLFHYLTVQATNSDRSHDPLEVLRAVHGFVKHYFGCTHCSKHFQEMAEKNQMWQVATKDDAVLWLWSAHNEVNRRLADDHTEDPAFPKVQYPLRTVCSQCYQQAIPVRGVTPSEAPDAPNWDKSEVLYYLRRVYSLFNLSRYGVDDGTVLPETLNGAFSAKLKSSVRSSYSSAFSDMDVRMGILLYAFCMLIIVVAVKLFLQRGYRKKAYAHDFLGKI